MFRIILLVLVVYAVFRFLNYRNSTQRPINNNYGGRRHEEGEYIDYEEVDDDEA